MYVCICTGACVYVVIYNIHVCMYACTCMCVVICTCMYMYACTCMCVVICTCMHVHVCVLLYVHVCTVHVCMYMYVCCYMYVIHVNEKCRRKEERSKQGQTNNKAKQHSTPKAVTFPKKNELPRVGPHVHVYTSQ